MSRAAARDYATRYLTEGVSWAYPSYDGYQADSAGGPLVDGDFLAPVLLNVPFLGIRTYEALQAWMAEMQSRLAEIPLDLELADADADSLALLGGLFSVLDGTGLFGVGGTVLAKVMHRKRPAFIPLYDERVRTVYQDGTGAPVPPEPGRTWERFMVRFGEAVRDDPSESTTSTGRWPRSRPDHRSRPSAPWTSSRGGPAAIRRRRRRGRSGPDHPGL